MHERRGLTVKTRMDASSARAAHMRSGTCPRWAKPQNRPHSWAGDICSSCRKEALRQARLRVLWLINKEA